MKPLELMRTEVTQRRENRDSGLFVTNLTVH